MLIFSHSGLRTLSATDCLKQEVGKACVQVQACFSADMPCSGWYIPARLNCFAQLQQMFGIFGIILEVNVIVHMRYAPEADDHAASAWVNAEDALYPSAFSSAYA